MKNSNWTGLTCAGILLLLAGAPAQADTAPTRPIGDSQVIAAVPFPGYPEGIAVKDDRIYVTGPAAFGVPGNFVPSVIHVYDRRTGAPLPDITIQNQPGGLHANSCITVDDNGNLYVVDEQLGIVKINIASGVQSVYAAPFYPVFQSIYNPPVPVLINDLAFDKNGYLYVTDSFQATIWRVPPGGGAPQVWFSDAAVDGIFGPNGVRVDEQSKRLYFTVSLDGTGGGYVYTLPLVDHPTLADLKLFHAFAPGAVPDGIAFGKSGSLYVALAGYSTIAKLGPDGSEQAVYTGPAQNPSAPGNPLPWANPANIAFDDQRGTLLVTNHASLTGLPDPSFLFAIFDVYVNDRGAKLFGNDPQ